MKVSEKARLDARFQFPFFRSTINALSFYKDSDFGLNVGTACIDQLLRVLYNEDFFMGLNEYERAGVVVHEAAHIVYRHRQRYQFAGFTNPRAWNIAADCEIHSGPGIWQCIKTIEGALHPSKYGWPVGRPAEFYYPLAVKLLEDQKKKQKKEEEGSGKGEGGGGNGEQNGQPNGGDEQSESSGGSGGSAGKQFTVGGGDCGSGVHGEPSDRELPSPENGGPPGVSDQKAQDSIQRNTMKDIVGSPNSPGMLGSNIVRKFSDHLSPNKISWEATLQGIICHATQAAASGDDDYRWVAEGRRNPSRERPSRKWLETKPNVLAAFDTSGSMSHGGRGEAALSAFIGLMPTVDSNVLYMCFDASLSSSGVISDPGEIEFKGGGGTCMSSALVQAVDPDFANEHGFPVPDVVVLFTDLETSWPSPGAVRDTPIIIVGCGDISDYWVQRVPKWADYIHADL